MTVVAAALTALPVSLLTIWALRRTPAAQHVVAAPRADRWHKRSTPLLGGSGIFVGLLAAAGVAVAAGVVPASKELAGILGGCAILFVAGLVDDVFGLSPLAKLGTQFAAAAVVLVAGVRVEIVGNNVAATVLGVVWLVGMTNAFNLLDNMDGLAATLLLPLLVLAVPILDTTLVTIVRLLEGRPITRGARDHTSHRLVYQGLSDRRAVVLLAGVSAALGLTSLAYNVLDDTRVTLVGVLITFAFLLQFGSYLADVGHTPVPDRAPSFVASLLVHRRRLIEVLVDFALITASFTIAYLLRLQGTGSPWQRHVFNLSLPAILVARYVAFIAFGLYRGVWRYAGARDAASIFGAVVASEAVAFLFVWATVPWDGFARGTYLIDVLLCSALVGASRFWERAFARGLGTLVGKQRLQRELIVGAGRSGRSLLRELRETPGERVIAFVDDEPTLRRRRIQGGSVVGGLDEIGWAVGRLAPDSVLVTIPDAPRERLDAVIEACRRAEVPCRFVRRQIELDPAVALGAAAE